MTSIVEAPDIVVNAINAIRTQIDLISSLSSGGIGLAILTWARILGIFDDADFSSFKKPAFLTLPVTLFIIAVICGYLTGAQITGYYLEVANGISASGKQITNAQSHFFEDYNEAFHWMMTAQLLSSVIGILTLSAWFGWNIFKKDGGKS